jgi:hypothetical protein
MNSKKQSVKQSLKKHYENASLTDNQLLALQQTLNSHQKNKYKNFGINSILKWSSSVVVSVSLVVMILINFQTPQLVSSAYADIFKDANLNNGMQIPMQQWLSENNISNIPVEYKVIMSKFCRINNSVTTHLRIAGKKQGEMNVFFHPGHASKLWHANSGKVDDMNWKLVNVREDLSLIVLYTHDMREKSVQYILGKLLPELEV